EREDLAEEVGGVVDVSLRRLLWIRPGDLRVRTPKVLHLLGELVQCGRHVDQHRRGALLVFHLGLLPLVWAESETRPIAQRVNGFGHDDQRTRTLGPYLHHERRELEGGWVSQCRTP